MGLRLPEGLPPIVLELAVGHFPIGDETLLRVLAAEWRKKAKRLRAMADTVDAAASGGTGSGRFDESIRSEASARAQELRDRAATFDSLAAQLDGFADTIELMKLQVSVMAVVLTAQLVVDFMMAGGPGTIKAAAHRARTKVAMAEAGTQGTARIAARAAANRAARQAIPSPRKLLVMGAGMGVAFGGGAPLVAQAIQKNVLNHTADKGYDWRSAGEGALAGLAGGLVGVEVVRRAAPRLGGFVNRAATSMSIRNPLGVRALGTASAMLLGGVSGAAGGILGTAVLVPIPGTQLTAKDWHMGVTTGFFGGALGAGGSAMAGLMGPHTPPGATAPVPVGAPSSGPRPPAVHARPGVRDPFGGHLLRLTPEQQEVLRRGGVRQPDPVVPPARMPAALAEPAPLGVVPGGRHPIVAESLRSTPQAAVTTQGAAVRAAAAAPSHAEPAGATTLRGAGTTAGGHPAPGAPPKVDSGAPSGIPPKLDLTGSGGGHGPAGRGAGDPPESPGQFSSGDHEPGIDADAPIDGGDIADNTSNDAGGSGDGDGFPPMDRYDGFDDSRWPPDRTLTDAEAIAAADAWDARPVAAEDPGRVVAHARTQAQRVESWWYSLGSGPEPSPAQIGLMWGAHNLVGNLEGIPPAVRDTANRIAVRRAVTAEWSSPGMHLHQLLEHKDLVDTADGQMAGQGGELKQAHLLTFVGHPQPDYYPPLMVEIAYGDIATADRVGVHAMSSVSGAEAIARRMPDVFGHFDQANAGSESVALVVRNHSETLPIPGVAPERETSRLLDERAGISLLNALAARHAGTGEVHVVAYSSMSDAVGWASRFGSLGEAGVVRISFPHVMPAGLLEHAAQLGVDQVFADPNTRTDHVAAAMDTDFGAGMVAELSPSTLADITLGRLDRVPVQLSEQMLLDRVQDRLDTGRLSRFLRTLDLAGAPPDRFGAGAAAMRTARTCDMAREMGLSDARIRQLLVEGTLGPGAAEVPGVPW
ncbi:MAG: hypothetical protein HOQ24_05330, partial [Mycobacteriaceae bacterium]|nr:hypothetical protein [Mycobacteriaceae bacterium]